MDLKRGVDQMFVNLHRLPREDEPDCPEYGYAEKVRLGAHVVHHMIGSDPSNDPAACTGGNARRRMHAECSKTWKGQGTCRTRPGTNTPRSGGDAASLTTYRTTRGA